MRARPAAGPWWLPPAAAEPGGRAGPWRGDEGHVHLTQSERSSVVLISILSLLLAVVAVGALLAGRRWLSRASAKRRPCPQCGTYYRPGVDAVCPSCGEKLPPRPG